MKDEWERLAPRGEHEPGISVRVAVAALIVLCLVVAAIYVVLFAH